MTLPELLMGVLVLTGLALLRFGVPALVVWSLGKILKRVAPSHT